MPPKRRDKENDSTKSSKTENTNGDHEQFLQAFEKPTQIYRYLRTRNMIRPLFLYRTLTYMKHRISRKKKVNRKEFRVDSLLQTVTARLQQQQPMTGFITLTFLGFHNQPATGQEEPVKIETILLKVCHKKRKDVVCPIRTVSLGTSYVPYNPSPDDPPAKVPTVCIPTESFALTGQQATKSFYLLLRVSTMSSNVSVLNLQDESEHVVKKRKTIKSEDDQPVYFTAHLCIHDKQNRFLLLEGAYDCLLDRTDSTSSKLFKLLSTWEDIGIDKEVRRNHMSSFENITKGPTLKFHLSWSGEQVTPLVDRPPLVLPMDISDKEKENARNGIENTLPTETMPVVYQFLYNSNSKQQTEASSDMHCPWCSLECKALYSLLKHLKLCHPRFNFTYAAANGGVRIDISVNDGYDGSSWNQSGGPVRGAGPTRRQPLSHVIVCRPKRTPHHLSEFIDTQEAESQRPYITGHNRLYHHTTTCLPIYPKEMEIDSEDETDPRWLQKKTVMMIDEFTDVNEGEKELMKMWNLHIMKQGFVGDCQIPLACTMFLQLKGKELLMKNLYRNFVIHMCNLFDYGLVSPVTLFTIMQKVQDIIQSDDEVNKVLQECWATQREHWNPVEQAPKFDSTSSPSTHGQDALGQSRRKPTEERGKRGRRGRRLTGPKPDLRSKDTKETSNKKSAP